MKTSRTDLLILGAGPAGCAAAIAGLQAWLSACLLEVQAVPRAHPGETLHPGVEPIFRQLGVWEALVAQQFHRHRGLWREGADGARVFEPYGRDEHGPWLGFQVDRVRLSELLRARVAGLGGTIIRVAQVDAVLAWEFAVAGVRADGCEYPARFVLDATGRHAWLAEKLGLVAERLEPAQRVLFGWTKEVGSELDGQPVFRQRADGWDWKAPLGDGRCAWAKLRRTSAGGGIDYAWRIFRECAGAGYFLLGDAGCLMDPSAANGVLRAMMSGIYSVHLMEAVLHSAVPVAVAASQYRQWVSLLFDTTRAGHKTASSANQMKTDVNPQGSNYHGATSRNAVLPGRTGGGIRSRGLYELGSEHNAEKLEARYRRLPS